MKDLEKTNVERYQSNRRARRRKKNMSVYYIMVVFLVICVGIALSMTVFFNIKQISLVGEANYSSEQILYAGDIAEGDNLVRINTDKVANEILDKLVYIDEVNIKKEFPSTLQINIKASVPKINIAYDGGYLLVSEGGKILEQLTEPRVDLLVVMGYEPEITDIAKKVNSGDGQKDKILNSIVSAIADGEISDVLSLDLTDKYNITLNYDNRVQIQLGNYNDINYKLRYANKILTESISNTKEGYLIMREGNEASFVTKEDMEKYRQEILNSESEPPATTISGEISTSLSIENNSLQTNIGEQETTSGTATYTSETYSQTDTTTTILTDEYGNIVQ